MIKTLIKIVGYETICASNNEWMNYRESYQLLRLGYKTRLEDSRTLKHSTNQSSTLSNYIRSKDIQPISLQRAEGERQKNFQSRVGDSGEDVTTNLDTRLNKRHHGRYSRTFHLLQRLQNLGLVHGSELTDRRERDMTTRATGSRTSNGEPGPIKLEHEVRNANVRSSRSGTTNPRSERGLRNQTSSGATGIAVGRGGQVKSRLLIPETGRRLAGS